MFALPFKPRSLRSALALTGGVLMAALLTIFLLMYAQERSRSRQSRAGADRGAAGLTARLLNLEDARDAHRTEVRASLVELHLALDLLAATGSRDAVAAATDRMRQAADLSASLYGLISEGDTRTQTLLEASRVSFAEALTALRQKATLPRERALAGDAEQKFAALHELGAAWRASRSRAAEARSDLTATLEGSTSSAKPVPSGNRINLLLAVAGAVAAGAAMAMAFLATRGLTKPVAYLVELAGDAAHGRARRRASPAEAGDLRELAVAFNRMTDAQQQAEERLRTANESLELKVSARTAELWRSNLELREEVEQRGRAERDFQQAQKMDALGKLAGSIAHDFNNLLTVIIGGAECAQKQLGPGHPTGGVLQTVQLAGERAAGLTRPLLTFSRNQVLAVEKVDLNEAAEEAARMMRRLLGVNVELRLDLEAGLPPLKTNGNQVQQVLINLGVNARDAMNGMGVLTIQTRTATRHEKRPRSARRRPAGRGWN